MPIEIAMDPGLCGRCAHAVVQESARGQTFWRCGAADTGNDLLRYPPLPVRACIAFERAPNGAAHEEPDPD